jgi:hypothetical protein
MYKYIYMSRLGCLYGTHICVPVRLYSHALYELTLYTNKMYLRNQNLTLYILIYIKHAVCMQAQLLVRKLYTALDHPHIFLDPDSSRRRRWRWW